MAQDRSRRRIGPPVASVTNALALLLIICLVECASEQSIVNRGSKFTNLVAKNNGWRATRGGSCLSYGHSCWGAHGKRSAKPPAAAPDWFIAKLLLNMDSNGELNRARSPNLHNEDSNAIYQMDPPDYSPTAGRLVSEPYELPLELTYNRNRNTEAKPMLDKDFLSKLKLWQIMRAASQE
ncbi:uncharacterized protein LOC113237904 isoform X1 [Hyposmocoma kahamanoa]|uniref:uncharacterized protein LOC113237904 isoform X1 n=1 Tax=Hyposmocoma kahamanoa TaxID=1477025 RepID=UPI000E6D5D0E|nr:uncharacterized protein LOC113237904 isoform X1 [Hyposmocoma kahamanoa]